MFTNSKNLNVVTLYSANYVSKDFSLEDSVEVVRYIFDRYFTEWNEPTIREYAHLNHKLQNLLQKSNYTLTKEQKELIDECATLINREILFKRVVETTNNIECPFKIQSKVKELLKGIALKQEYTEQYKTNSATLQRQIKKDIVKEFVKQFYIVINDAEVQVYGEDFIEYLKQKKISISVDKRLLQDLIFFRPANKFGIASKTLKKTLIVVEKEDTLLPTFIQYRNYIENKIFSDVSVGMKLTSLNG